ncbi:hypothetical protein EV188_105222 [Actinomycetospora succinea]|uniref:Uncharacterized protein n=1 Tax=Actinomycetospora succinea TaxID=663603 RepID=A0A4R6V614_9PSEU|nr:hypothetical protein [Actinomycetospora succinea]TDQ55824.1 hypothetical protein EV188_105222 [Actinomycetospora succinea]
MRSALLLLGGLVLIGAGIAVIALEVPGRWVLGPALIAGGLLAKVAGFLLTGDAPPSGSGRTVTTLGTAGAERPRSGPTAGRTSALRRARTARTARASEAARVACEGAATHRRTAS